jgi:para-nitrobenzyl esterase
LGAAHGFEIPFVFGHWQLGPYSERLFNENNRAGREALSETMMAYWTEHAFSGGPGRGRDGRRPRWTRWGDGPGGEAYVVLDSEAGGGVRMAAGALTRERLLERLDADVRLLSRSRRCGLVKAMTRWSKQVTEQDYQERCPRYPGP